MSLSLKPLYEAAVRRFQTTVDSDRFNDDFPFAVNLTLDQLGVIGNPTTPYAHVDDVEADLTDFSAEYSAIIYAGICFHIADLGHQLRGGEKQYIEMAGAWEDAKGDYMVLLNRSDAATVDDDGDPTGDIIGLGAKG